MRKLIDASIKISKVNAVLYIFRNPVEYLLLIVPCHIQECTLHTQMCPTQIKLASKANAESHDSSVEK